MSGPGPGGQGPPGAPGPAGVQPPHGAAEAAPGAGPADGADSTACTAPTAFTGCADCAAAARGLWLVLCQACAGCRARGVGRGPLFFEAQQAGELTPAYLAQLRAARLRHAQVGAARAADWMCRRAPQAG